MASQRRKAHWKGAVVFAMAAVAVGVPGTAQTGGSTIPAGFDLFETDPQTTVFSFQGSSQLPANFFGPGSDPFSGDVNFGGVPLGTFGGAIVGDADAVVRRTQAATPSPNAQVPIELVALSLASVQPITVTSNGGQSPEQWDITAGLSSSAPSQGQMDIFLTNPNGGDFNSQLRVFPLFTFTRLSDGQTRTFDGANLPPQQTLLIANGVPWRNQCVLPALSVPGVNDGFCPSYDGRKILTVEQAQIVRHGVRPAQPATEHFKCYVLKREKFNKREVNLTDQFGTRRAKVANRRELCNPVRKNDELFVNKAAHFVCYATKGPKVEKLVAVRNQFGSQQLTVHRARRLCVPSEKREQGQRFKPIKTPIDHYQCYSVTEQSALRRFGQLGSVRLKDQFGRENVTVGKAFQLCAPVQKNSEQIQHPVIHGVCYRIRDARVEEDVQIDNQFEQVPLTTKRPVSLCVPSIKLVL